MRGEHRWVHTPTVKEHTMWKKIAIAGVTAALIGGAGTAALAASGSGSAPSATGSGSALLASAGHSSGESAAITKALSRHPGLIRLRNLQHATWVTGDANGSFVTHDAIHGTVTAISTTSITVKAKDNVSQTYVINSDTKVHSRAEHKGASISDVKAGDEVLVAGTGTDTLTATQIVDTAK
jgi:hypothetical protein